MYFEKSKTISSTYTIKKEEITLDIDITTLSLTINDNEIKLNYLVTDSNNKYEYYIMRSD